MVLVTTQQTVDTLKNLGKREDRQSLVLSPCTFGRERSGFILITPEPTWAPESGGQDHTTPRIAATDYTPRYAEQ